MRKRSAAVVFAAAAVLLVVGLPWRAAAADPWLANLTIPGGTLSVGGTVTVTIAAETLQHGALDGTIQVTVTDDATGQSQPVSSALPASDFLSARDVTFPATAAGSFTATARFAPSASSTTAASDISGRFTVMRHDATLSLQHAEAVVGAPLDVAVSIALPRDITAVGGAVSVTAQASTGSPLAGQCVPQLTGDSTAGCTVALSAPATSGSYQVFALWTGSPGFIEAGYQGTIDVTKRGSSGGGTTAGTGNGTGNSGVAPLDTATETATAAPEPTASATLAASVTASTFDPLPWILLLSLIALILIAGIVFVILRLRAARAP